MKLKTIATIAIAITSCNIGEKGVKYDEMASHPKLSFGQNELIVKLENSKENSALLIYELQLTIDTTNKTVLIYGFQAVGKEYKTEFKIPLKDIDPKRIDDFKIYWIDPDSKRTELRIEDR